MTRWLSWVVYGVAFVVFKVAFRYRIVGRENLAAPDGGSAVLVGNHMSMVDPLFVILATRNNVRFIAKEELFAPDSSAFVAQGCARMGVIPIKRDSADRTAIMRCVKALRRGEFVGIYPEGTRVMPGHESEYKHHAGAVLIANMARRPVIPVGISGTERIKPRGQRLMHFPNVVLRIGEPIDPHAFDALPKAQRASACTEEVMRICYALRDGTDPGPLRLPAADDTAGEHIEDASPAKTPEKPCHDDEGKEGSAR